MTDEVIRIPQSVEDVLHEVLLKYVNNSASRQEVIEMLSTFEDQDSVNKFMFELERRK